MTPAEDMSTFEEPLTVKPDANHTKTIPARGTLAEKRAIRAGALVVIDDVDVVALRPRTRGDCKGSLRPCPFVSCSHHLYLDVNPVNGAIKLNFPHLEVWQMGDTCSLDVADRGGVTLEAVGAALNLTRERVRQIEVSALIGLKRAVALGKELK
jgi:Sigma-70, region 4